MSCRQPDQSSHKSRLLAQLAEAHDAWRYMKDDKGGRIPTRADQEGLNRRRHAAQLALGAFLEWAHAEGDIPSEHLILLVELVSGLGDLNRGRQPELMKPAPREKRGNPGLSQADAFRLGTACAAIDILSDNRADSVANMEKEVAGAIGMEVSALKSWRKAFNAKRRKDPQPRIAYNSVLQILREQDDPHEAARRLLRKMRGP
jgi:3-oxoacyl-(acyl-carrier-protein) synthase